MSDNEANNTAPIAPVAVQLVTMMDAESNSAKSNQKKGEISWRTIQSI